MRIITPKTRLREKLVKMGAEEKFVNTFMNSDFLVIEEKGNDLIGVAGVGGIFHVGGIFVQEEFRGTGLGSKLNLMRDEEIKKRGYSFFIGTTYRKNPTAKPISKILDERKAHPVFAFNYYEGFITTLYIQEFNLKGRIMGKFLNFFNNKFGTLCLAIMLKLGQKFWNQLFLAESTEKHKINIGFSVRNFQKI